MNDTASTRPALAAIDVSGPDAVSFLQGQLSADVAAVTARSPALAAWINPAGRVIVIADLLRTDDGIRAFVPGSLAEAIVERLRRFVFRARVSLTLRQDTLADVAATPRPGAIHRGSASGACESFSTGPALTNAIEHPVHDFIAARVAQGIPWIDSALSERFTAHQLNLDLLGAVSLTKGCYSGQEIVARTAHRGRARRRLYGFAASGDATADWHGDAVFDGDAKVGEIVSAGGARCEDYANVLVLKPTDHPGDTLVSERGIELVAIDLPYAIPAPG